MKPYFFLTLSCFILIGSFILSAYSDKETGTIQGRVLLEGNVPDLPQIVAEKNIDFCGETLTDFVLVVEDQGVQGAVISIDWKGHTPIKSASKFISLQSRQCRFQPRIQATEVGAFLELKSGDKITHNPHGWWNDTKTVFNITLLNPNSKFKRKLRWDGIYRVECDTHTWMKAYIWVFKHPFYAVTDAKGDFVLGNVPVGNYTIRVWHEVLGEQTSMVVVKPDKVTQANFICPLIDHRAEKLKPKTTLPWPPNKDNTSQKSR